VLAVKEYEQCLKDRESAVARREQIYIRLGYIRLLPALVQEYLGSPSRGTPFRLGACLCH
jgi:hypothetical protein